MSRLKTGFLTLVILLSFGSITAQKFKKKSKYMSVGPIIGSINYFGELNTDQSRFATSLQFTRWNIGGVLTKRLHPRITARTTLSWGRLQGADAKSSNTEGLDIYRKARNLTFRNDIIEFKADGVVDLFQNRKGVEKRQQITPYGFLGIAVFYNNPKGYFEPEDRWVALQPLGTEGQFEDDLAIEPYSRVQIAVPFGVGVRYKLSILWDIAFEIGFRKTFTDYIDDVGGTFIDKARFDPGSPEFYLSDPSVYADDNPLKVYTSDAGYRYTRGFEEGYQRGGDGDDWYVVTGFHITYIFHPKLTSPKFKG